MSPSYNIKSTLEELPDELLLIIFQYLSSTDILFSFYGLNTRLSQTISGFYRHIVLAQVRFTQFNYICTSILPKIGTNICSLVVSNQWKGILSKTFLNYFGENLSLTFPHLRHLTLIAFNDNSLGSFLDYLHTFSEMHKISICQLSQTISSSIESETLLHRIFTANNNQLNSFFFDAETIVFSIEHKNLDILYSNVEKLTIDLKTINDLHQLLTLLPHLISMNVTINKGILELNKQNQNIPIINLKQFQLQSFGQSWDFDELLSILNRMPNVEELSIAIETDHDTYLIDGEKFFSRFSPVSLRKFNYFIRYYDLSFSIDHTKIPSTWKQFKQEFVCIKSDDKKTIVLYTLPFIFSYLILSSSLAKNEVFLDDYAPQVENLTLCQVSTHMIDTFSIIKKCHRIHNLDLRLDKTIETKFPKDIRLCKLPYLTKISARRKLTINTEYFQRLLEVSPNLHHLEVNYEFLRPLLDNETVCLLLKHRITHIYFLISLSTSLEPVISSMSHLASIFSSLKHLYFSLEKGYQSSETLILTVLNCICKWNCLISFGVANAVMVQKTLSEDIQQWLLQKSIVYEHNSFVFDYFDELFRLWL